MALFSKIYALSQPDGTEKLASKGFQKKALLYNLGNAVNESISVCLHEGQETMVQNTSFRLHLSHMHTVLQKKSAVNQVYTKRRVLADGVSTEPLDLVLRPYKRVDRGVRPQTEVGDEIEQPMEYIDGADEIGDDEDEARVRVELGLSSTYSNTMANTGTSCPVPV